MNKQIEIRLANILNAQMDYILSNKDLSKIEKAEQGSVIINTMKFLMNYEENIKILDKYAKFKKQDEKEI